MNDASKNKIETTEILLSKTLKFGVIVSATVIGIGLIMLLVTGDSGYPVKKFPTSIAQIVTGLVSLKPYAVIMAGILLLILTPVYRVAASIITFMHEKDFRYVIITSIVIIILLLSFFLGKGE